MYLEFIKPNQTLLGLLMETQQISDISPAKALSKRALMLRDILSGYGDKLSKTMLNYLHRAIALTIDPITETNVPKKPDPEAYDLSKEEQLHEFITEYNRSFDSLLECAKKTKYNDMAGAVSKFEDPQDRYLVLSELLREIMGYLTVPTVKQVHFGMSQTYTLMENDLWPGRMITEINPQDKNRALELVATSANAMEDQSFFRLLSTIDGGEVKKETVVPIFDTEENPPDVEPKQTDPELPETSDEVHSETENLEAGENGTSDESLSEEPETVTEEPA